MDVMAGLPWELKAPKVRARALSPPHAWRLLAGAWMERCVARTPGYRREADGQAVWLDVTKGRDPEGLDACIVHVPSR